MSGVMLKQLKRFLLIVLLTTALAPVQALAADIELDMSFMRGRVFIKSPDKEPFEAHAGQYRLPLLTSVVSLADGQCFMQLPVAELRTKQETILAILGDKQFELRQGLAGFRIGSDTVKISTAHLGLEVADALIVIKANPVLTRLCVIKGKAVVEQGKSKTTVLAGQEIAAAPQRLSQVYKQSDELRFTWYWVSADKEPALQ
ncbi:MAG TPA: hypothetical protein DCG57_11950 [Candidatus Riflebacteria bacterium]|jgi:hypothetical protein|nr:hypothetical protein [Candidatus Riflebacteria bacterium]